MQGEAGHGVSAGQVCLTFLSQGIIYVSVRQLGSYVGESLRAVLVACYSVESLLQHPAKGFLCCVISFLARTPGAT